MAIKRDDFPLPDVDDPLTAPFFAGAARGELVITALRRVRRVRLVPAGRVPALTAARSRGRRCRGGGTLFSWAVVRRAFLPAFEEQVPFVTALVALDEDPAVRLRDVPRRRRARRRCVADEPVVVDVPAAVVPDGARPVGDRPDVPRVA